MRAYHRIRPIGVRAERPAYTVHEIKSAIETLHPREKIDQEVISLENLQHMAAAASIIPKSTQPGKRLIDIGGRVYWIPIYTKLLGYDHITILERPGGSFSEGFQIAGQGEEFAVDVIAA